MLSKYSNFKDPRRNEINNLYNEFYKSVGNYGAQVSLGRLLGWIEDPVYQNELLRKNYMEQSWIKGNLPPAHKVVVHRLGEKRFIFKEGVSKSAPILTINFN